MAKEVLAVDCDDTLISYTPEYLEFLSQRIGRRVDSNMMKTTEWHVHAGLTKEEFYEHVVAFSKSPYILDLPDITGAREKLYELKRRYDIHIVTARPNRVEEINLEEITRVNLERRFPSLVSDVHHTKLYDGNELVVRQKSDVCLKIGANKLIEDNPTEARRFVANGYVGRTAILMLNTTWAIEANRIGLPRGIVTMINWSNTVDLLLKMGL